MQVFVENVEFLPGTDSYPTVTTLYSYCDAYDISLTEFVKRAFSFIKEPIEIDGNY